MTTFDAETEAVHELPAGHVAVMKNSGGLEIEPFARPREESPCSFERIYFSRGNDPDIYQERKQLGAALVPQILDSIDNKHENTVVSFIPNTAEIAYQGVMSGLRMHRRDEVKAALMKGLARWQPRRETRSTS